jgi:acetyltransferase-like isoleucine patch superfamily enzyme
MKSIVRILCNFILRFFGAKGFINEAFGVNVIMRQFIIQKVLRINSSVPWPVHYSSKVISPENMLQGSRFPGLSMQCYFDARNGIELGQNVWIGPKVNIVSMNHNTSEYTEYIPTNKILIGDNCWLGANSTILPGVNLGDHTVVAAGAVVTKSFPEGDQIIGGNPARVIKALPAYNEIKN